MDMVGYYCFERNLRKAAMSLKGILRGVVADSRLSELEVLYLDVWLKSQAHLRDNPDAIDLIDAIGDILSDGVISKDEEEDLMQLIEDMIEFGSYPEGGVVDRVNEFLGIVSGVVADDSINSREMLVLINWMEQNKDLHNSFPISLIVSNFDQMKACADRESYSEMTFRLLKKISGARFSETGSSDAHPLSFIEDELSGIDHSGKRVCISGGFDLGSRDDVCAIAEARGYTIMGAVSGRTDYLVFGSQVSPDWGVSSFGRKIENAVRLRAEGKPVRIISEDQWLRHLGYDA